jgi:hypothetical protein
MLRRTFLAGLVAGTAGLLVPAVAFAKPKGPPPGRGWRKHDMSLHAGDLLSPSDLLYVSRS